MLQILTKAIGIRTCSDTNGKLHEELPQLWADGHFSATPHFVLTDAYLTEYTIILMCSFLDEYNKFFIPNNCLELKTRITVFRKQIKPVLNKINQWTDLHKYRNMILAHNLRTKDNQSILDTTTSKIEFNIPNTKNELRLLVQLASLITQNIGEEFPEIRERINFEEKITDKINAPYKMIDFKSQFEAVGKEIKKAGLNENPADASLTPTWLRKYDNILTNRNRTSRHTNPR